MINIIASRYAEALFQVGEENNSTTKLYEELNAVLDILKSDKSFYNVLKSPLISKGEKKDIIENIFNNRVQNDLKNFFKLLIDKERISSLELIHKSFKSLLNEKNNIVEGKAITAIPMSKEEIKKLEENLSNKYNTNIILENVVDKTILGGVLVKLGNKEIDGTIKTRLDNLKQELSQVIS